MTSIIAQKLRQALTSHEEWRSQCLNLIPSENITSPLVRQMLASDFGHRYYWDDPWYGGQKYSEQVEQLAIQAAKQLFNVRYANVRPLSGHMSLMTVLIGLLEPGDSVVISSFENGGYPLNLQARFPLNIHYFPYKEDSFVMDDEGAVELIQRVKPKVAILGASLFPFPHPVKAIAKAAQNVGTTLVYDGSHVLGLIAGGEFQDPLGEGADILLGSTHKTLPGPQGGIVLVKKDMDLAERIDLTLRPPPVLVDNFHMHRVAGLGIALTELIQFGKEYAHQIVQNAKTLARTLHERDVQVVGAKYDFTASHQILLKGSVAEGHKIRDQLEVADIIADAGVRLGTQEVTRRGMKTAEMKQITELISDIIVYGKNPAIVKEKVHELTKHFQKVHYCFDEEK
ncbi:MAG: serine hydroxymethyltransferase [Promethearchaeota archaeon]